jgi:hypothetical protein
MIPSHVCTRKYPFPKRLRPFSSRFNVHSAVMVHSVHFLLLGQTLEDNSNQINGSSVQAKVSSRKKNRITSHNFQDYDQNTTTEFSSEYCVYCSVQLSWSPSNVNYSHSQGNVMTTETTVLVFTTAMKVSHAKTASPNKHRHHEFIHKRCWCWVTKLRKLTSYLGDKYLNSPNFYRCGISSLQLM